MDNHTHHTPAKENKTIISFKNSFWLVIIIVGLFIAALNFVKAESGGEQKSDEGSITQPQPDSPKIQPAGPKSETGVGANDSAFKSTIK